MFSKNQLKQKQVIHLGDTGGHWGTLACLHKADMEQKTRLLRLQQLMVFKSPNGAISRNKPKR